MKLIRTLIEIRTMFANLYREACIIEIQSSKQHISCLAIIKPGKRTYRITILLNISHLILFDSY